MVSTNDTDRRAAYIEGLRLLAGLLEQHDDVPLPYHGNTAPLNWILTAHGDNQRELLVRIARLIPGHKQKSTYSGLFDVEGRLAGLAVGVVAEQAQVCDRIVTGTREVTRTVPDPAAPTVEVTETEEIVEWVCRPLLAEAGAP